MAESDTAGPAPRRKRPWGILDAAREAERSFAPVRAAIEQAERNTAPLRAAAKKASAMMRAMLGEEDEDPPPPSPVLAADPKPPAALPPAPPCHRPAFEVDPPKDLLAALREAFPGFKPTGQWWFYLETQLKDSHYRSNFEAHEAFCRAYENWSAEDLLRHLEAEGRVKPLRKPRGDTTCERLRDLHLHVDPEFAETASLRKLAKHIERSTGAIDGSTYYQTKLKPIREEIAARKKAAKAAQRWGDFNSVGRSDTTPLAESGPEDH
jgi:hypothetical protein